MAFATTNVQKNTLGSIKATTGKWTTTGGEAAGTIGVEGGYVIAAIFTSVDSSGAISPATPRVSVSVTRNVSTITVYHQEAVADGRFIIIHG